MAGSADDARAAEVISSDDTGRAVLQRRVLIVVVTGQVLGGAGLAAGVMVGALLAEQMLGSDDLSGLPTALFRGTTKKRDNEQRSRSSGCPATR